VKPEPVRVAVVGHTNTGKTSLMRTLLRDVAFGEVSDRPATTRHVEGAALLVEGEPLLELYDTPGLEDSIGLLERLDDRGRAAGPGRPDWPQVLDRFLDSPEADRDFAQEKKALRQVRRCDLALYVIDARERVLGKHRDELEILTRCARPVVPVLNFTAGSETHMRAWRDQLARLNLHAVAEFDTVVLDEHGERRLLEKMQTLLDERRAALQRVIDDRARLRQRLLHAGARMVANMLIDAAACTVLVPVEEEAAAARQIEQFKREVVEREERCLRQLLELHRFRPDDAALGHLSIQDGRWGFDVFSPAALRQFGVRAGSAVAAGAAAGLVIDAMLGGLSLGAATAAGAALGAAWQTGRSYGRRVLERMRGRRELRCDDATLHLLLERQTALLRVLAQRGHAAVRPAQVGPPAGGPEPAALPPELLRARGAPGWSSLPSSSPRGGWRGGDDAGRAAAEERLAGRIAQRVERAAGAEGPR
jgi:hypothetical protein